MFLGQGVSRKFYSGATALLFRHETSQNVDDTPCKHILLHEIGYMVDGIQYKYLILHRIAVSVEKAILTLLLSSTFECVFHG